MARHRSIKVKESSGSLLDEYYGETILATAPTVTDQVWARNGGGFFSVSSVQNKLKAGTYKFVKTQQGIIIVPHEVVTDALSVITDEEDNGHKVIGEAAQFWKTRERYRVTDTLHRRGYLLHGPPGTGKTCIVHQITAIAAAEQDCVSFVIDSGSIDIFSYGLQMFRAVEPDRPAICVFEDIEKLLEDDEQGLLSYLDGEDSIDHVINVATTNHLDRLPERIKSRPRRFDRTIKIPSPNAAMRKQFFEGKLKDMGGEEAFAKLSTDFAEGTPTNHVEFIKVMVSKSKGFSFAALADLFISVVCMCRPIETSAANLKSSLQIQDMD